MEFLETHTSNAAKAVWKNDIDIPMTVTEKSDDDESKDDESKDDKYIKSEESGDDENEEKIADKVISDLEVHHNSAIISGYNALYKYYY